MGSFIPVSSSGRLQNNTSAAVYRSRLLSSIPAPPTRSDMASATTFYDFTPKDKRDQDYPLAQHKGKVILAVNTASKCGFTPQFAGLESLWKKISEKYPDQFVIIGFPCNQFGGQDQCQWRSCGASVRMDEVGKARPAGLEED